MFVLYDYFQDYQDSINVLVLIDLDLVLQVNVKKTKISNFW